MSELTAAQIKSKRTVYLVLSTLTLLFLGLIYAFSMFAAPMCLTFGLEKADVALTFNIMMIAFCVGATLGSFTEKKIGVKGNTILAGVMFFIGFVGTGMFAHNQLFVVYVLYGVCAGAGVGVGYNTICATTNQWFPDKVGFSSGVLMMGFGVSALIIGNISVGFIDSLGLTTVFTVLGVATLVVSLVCAFVLQRPPADIVAIMMPERAGAAGGSDPADEDSPLKTPMFYVYWVWAIIVIGIGLATIGNCASDAQMVGIDASTATFLVGVVSTANGCARVIMGMVYDKTNVKITMLVDAIIAVAATAFILGAFLTGMGVLYICGAICCGFCYGAVPVVAAAMSRQRFGSKNYPLNLSLANFAIVFGSLLNIAVQAAVGGSTERMAVFGVMAVLAVVAALDVLPFSKMWDKNMKVLDEKRQALKNA